MYNPLPTYIRFVTAVSLLSDHTIVHKMWPFEIDVFCQRKEIPKQTLVPRYSGLSREVVSSQGGLSRGATVIAISYMKHYPSKIHNPMD